MLVGDFWKKNNLCIVSSKEDILNFVRIHSTEPLISVWSVAVVLTGDDASQHTEVLEIIDKCLKLGIFRNKVNKNEIEYSKWSRVLVNTRIISSVELLFLTSIHAIIELVEEYPGVIISSEWLDIHKIWRIEDLNNSRYNDLVVTSLCDIIFS